MRYNGVHKVLPKFNSIFRSSFSCVHFFPDANPLLSGESNYEYHNSHHETACIRLDLLHMQTRFVGINGILYFMNQLLLYIHPSSKPHNFDMSFLHFFEAEVTSKYYVTFPLIHHSKHTASVYSFFTNICTFINLKCTFINLKNTLKFTLKHTKISLLHVSVFDHHQGACTEPG